MTHVDNGLHTSDEDIGSTAAVEDRNTCYSSQQRNNEENHHDLRGQDNSLKDCSSFLTREKEGCA